MQEILPVLQLWADYNEKEIDICDLNCEKMLRKEYLGRQVEYNESRQHKIDHVNKTRRTLKLKRRKMKKIRK